MPRPMVTAIVQIGSRQYKVEKGAKVPLDYIDGKKAGDTVELDHVLLVRDGEKLKVGTPLVKGAKVVAKVLENVRGEKIFSFKFRRREGYHRKKGHREKYTIVEVTDVTA